MSERIGKRFRELRRALGLTQEQTAQLSGGLLSRGYVAQIESSDNKGRSAWVRDGYARAFGLDRAIIDELIAGTESVENAVVYAREGRTAVKQPTPAHDATWTAVYAAELVRLKGSVHAEQIPPEALRYWMNAATAFADAEQAARGTR